MAEVRPDEVSAILRQQLSNFKSEAELEEVGTVLQVGDGVARIYGLSKAQAGELIEFENGLQGLVLNLEEDNVGAVMLGDYSEIREGATVKRTNKIASIKVGEGIVGRVVNTLGQPIDGRGPIAGELYEMPLERKAPGVIFRQPVTEPMQTGIKSIDAMIPIGRGQRELIIGDRQTGKSAVAIDTIINQREFFEAGQPVFCIYVAIGQKASTVAQVVQALTKGGAMDYTVVVVGVGFRPGAAAILRALHGGGHWRVLPRHGPPGPGGIRRLVASRPWLTARCRCCCAALPDGKPTPATCSTCTAACWSGPLKSTLRTRLRGT